MEFLKDSGLVLGRIITILPLLLLVTLYMGKRAIGELPTFEPTIVIQNGKLLKKNLGRIHYSIDNVLQMLREKEIFDISEVETAIIEASGNLSVLKKSEKNAVTREDMKLAIKTSAMTYPVVIEGIIYSQVLNYLCLDEAWLMGQIKDRKLSLQDIFLASINQDHELHISLKNEDNIRVPILKH